MVGVRTCAVRGVSWIAVACHRSASTPRQACSARPVATLPCQDMPDSTRPYIGGQAVIEGVMMRAPKCLSVAVRRPDGTIAVREGPLRAKLLERTLQQGSRPARRAHAVRVALARLRRAAFLGRAAAQRRRARAAQRESAAQSDCRSCWRSACSSRCRRGSPSGLAKLLGADWDLTVADVPCRHGRLQAAGVHASTSA